MSEHPVAGDRHGVPAAERADEGGRGDVDQGVQSERGERGDCAADGEEEEEGEVVLYEVR